VFALLSDYLDLELPADACAEVEAHLADCPPCVEFAESLRKTVELCRNYQPDELPAPLGEQARDELLEAYQKMLAGRRTA
jgi:RNA polymerase sigma-70 factor (ECF subfamily)